MESAKATTRAGAALENRAGRAKQEPATFLNRPSLDGAVSSVRFVAAF